MAQEMPGGQQALPVFKVLYRNTNRIQEHGGRKSEVLHAVKPAPLPAGRVGGQMPAGGDAQEGCERRGADCSPRWPAASPEDAFNALLHMVQDHTEVHRVVLPYRAWDLLGIIGKEQAHTLLRQSVRYCVNAESRGSGGATTSRATLLPKLLDEHKLLGRTPGDRKAEDAWVEQAQPDHFQIHRRSKPPPRPPRRSRKASRPRTSARPSRSPRINSSCATWAARPHGGSHRQAARQRAWRFHRRPRLRLRQRLAQHGPRGQRAELLRQPHPRRLSGGARPHRARRRFPQLAAAARRLAPQGGQDAPIPAACCAKPRRRSAATCRPAPRRSSIATASSATIRAAPST